MPSGHGDKDELVELFRDEFVELFKPAELAGRVSSAAAACTSNSHVVLIREIFRLSTDTQCGAIVCANTKRSAKLPHDSSSKGFPSSPFPQNRPKVQSFS